MLHPLCKHSALQNHKTNKHENGLKFQTVPNPRLRPFHCAKKKKIHTTHSYFAAFLKQENVNMVIFSTCFKTDQFSQAGRSWEREGEWRSQAGRKRDEKKWPTHDRRPPQNCVCVAVCAMWTGCGFLCLHTVPPRALAQCWWPQRTPKHQTGSVTLWV